MNRKPRRLLALLCVLVCIVSTTLFPVQAATVPETPEIMPHYIGISSMTCSFSVLNSAGLTESYGTVRVYDGYTVYLTLELERSSDAENWSVIKTWTTSGTGRVSLDQYYYVVSGYFYRAYCTASIYDSNGNYVELEGFSSGYEWY